MIQLFKKWLVGNVTWKEEKELRKKAEVDPFLADALEGYDAFPRSNHEEQLAVLQERTRPTTPPNKKKNFLYIRRAIAASIILIASVGVFQWTQNQFAAPSDLAHSSQPMIEKSVESTNRKSVTDQATQATPIPSTSSNQLIQETAAITNDPPTVVSELSKPNKATKPITTIPLKRSPLPSSTPTLADHKEMQEVQVPSAASAPPSPDPNAAYATSPSQTAEDAAIIAQEVHVPTTAAKSSSKEEARMEQIAVHTKKSTNSLSIEKEQIAEIANANSFQEEVYARSNPAYRKTSAKIRSLLQDRTEGMPTGGIEVFQQFISTNLRYPEAAKAANITGIVVLQFKVSADGTPQKIKLSQKLGYGCDEEAIRLLKAGPKWTLTGKKGRCAIFFE